MLEGQPTAQLGDLSIAAIAEGIQGVPDTSVSARYAEMKDTAKSFLQELQEVRHTSVDTLASFKEKLADVSAPFADNPAFQALLELELVAKLGAEE